MSLTKRRQRMTAITEAIKRIEARLKKYPGSSFRGLTVAIGILKEEAEKKKDLSYKMKCKKRDMEKKISVLEGTIDRQSKTIKKLGRLLLTKANGGDQ